MAADKAEEPAREPPGEGGEGGGERGAGGAMKWVGWAVRTLLIAQLVQGAVRLATQGVPPQQGAPQRRAAVAAQTGSGALATGELASGDLVPDRTAFPAFRWGSLMDVAVWTTHSEGLSDESRAALVAGTPPSFSSNRVPFGAGLSRGARVELGAEDLAHVREGNGTLWAQVSVVPSGTPHWQGAPGYVGWAGQWGCHPVVVHRRVRPRKEPKYLLGGSKSGGEEEGAPGAGGGADSDTGGGAEQGGAVGGVSGEGADSEPGEGDQWLPFLKPNVTVSIVADVSVFPPGRIPPTIADHLDIDSRGRYKPVVFMNDFWTLAEHLVPVNASSMSAHIHFHVDELSLMKWQLYLQFEQSFQMQETMGMAAAGESDTFKRMFLENNPYFLALTIFVSLLHTVFDMLAFRSDIGFWHKRKNLEGLSTRTVVINCFCQTVIFLYLLDNDTSYMVLLSSGLGLAVEYWKLTRAMKFEFIWERSYGVLPFKIIMSDRDTYKMTDTKRYDAEAMRYLSYVLYPLVACYAVYSLMYKSHSSWYSWLLSSLVGAVYTFGFILMCPQLYINYKMQSVAHLPWRQMTYKFLNTIIDDLFAFVIKMPALHRLSVFRDDLVFAVFLYQRWAYREDKTRVNEFGFSAEPPPGEAEAEAGATGEEAAPGESESKKDR